MQHLVADSLQRFVTGVYIGVAPARHGGQGARLPKRCARWHSSAGKAVAGDHADGQGSKLARRRRRNRAPRAQQASGVSDQLPTPSELAETGTPQLVAALGQDRNAAFTLNGGG